MTIQRENYKPNTATERRSVVADPSPFSGDSFPELRRMSDVKAETVEHLWSPRIPLGKVSLIAGPPGLGKSMLTIDIAARVSAGLDWPDGAGRATVGSVLILALEDDAGDTIRPRLDAAGADVEHCYLVQSADLADGLDRVDAMLDHIGDVRLIIIDPVTGFLGRTNANKESEVRAALTPLVELAARRKIAVIGIMHLRKADAANALNLVAGSVAFTALARAVWMVHASDEGDERTLVAGKMNMSRAGKSLRFKIIEPGRVEWLGESAVTAREAFAPADRFGGSQQQKAVKMIRDLLAAGPMPSADLEKQITDAGISRRTYMRARPKAGVQACPPARPGEGPWTATLAAA